MSNKIVSNPLPTLEQALKLSNHYKDPKNYHIFIMTSVVPSVRPSGLEIDRDSAKHLQSEFNKGGMLVVKSPFYKENLSEKTASAVFAGDRILFSPNTEAAFMTTITSDLPLEGVDMKALAEINTKRDRNNQIPSTRKFILMCIRASDVICTLNDIEG